MTRRVTTFKHLSASCILVVEDGVGMVSQLYAKTRHQGHATALLTTVIKYADENDLELYLRAQAYGHPVQTILSNDDLVRLYQKFGFVEQEYAPGLFPPMVRPRRKNTPYNEREY